MGIAVYSCQTVPQPASKLRAGWVVHARNSSFLEGIQLSRVATIFVGLITILDCHCTYLNNHDVLRVDQLVKRLSALDAEGAAGLDEEHDGVVLLQSERFRTSVD